jgi:hypothetical protein
MTVIVSSPRLPSRRNRVVMTRAHLAWMQRAADRLRAERIAEQNLRRLSQRLRAVQTIEGRHAAA